MDGLLATLKSPGLNIEHIGHEIKLKLEICLELDCEEL